MQNVKRCARCGAAIANWNTDDYFRCISVKWCARCGADVRREQTAAAMRRLRAKRREAHRLTAEQNSLLKAENELLRQAIRRLECKNM